LSDVRSIPRSRTNSQFNQQSLPEALASWQIGYEHIAELQGYEDRISQILSHAGRQRLERGTECMLLAAERLLLTEVPSGQALWRLRSCFSCLSLILWP
jgi:hypothetical protein